MKKFFFTLVIAVSAVVNVNAMSPSRSSSEARFLTDKMAWELSLNSQQIEAIYEINYDYFRSLDDINDYNHLAYDIRNEEIFDVLSSVQWTLFKSIDYFLTPVRIINNAWHFLVHNHYAYNQFYYDAPRGYRHYNGGHAHDRGYYNHGYAHNRGYHNGHIGMNQHRPQMGHNNNVVPRHHNNGQMHNGQMHNGQHNNGQKHGNGQMHQNHQQPQHQNHQSNHQQSQNHQRPQNGMNNSNRGNGSVNRNHGDHGDHGGNRGSNGNTRSNNGNMANGAHRGARR